MKKRLGSLIFIVFISVAAHSQDAKPQLLFEPATWAFERFKLPPEFALSIPYKGVEELRFSPGMFNKDSTTYVTYAFVAQLDEVTSISQNDIQDYLLKYFKGLCGSTARDRKLEIDTTRITVHVEKKKDTPANEIIYDASLNIFGVFADGAPVKLNAEIKVLINAAAKKVYLVFTASPRERSDAVWKELYEIQKGFTMPQSDRRP
jgi:hypothetical protein